MKALWKHESPLKAWKRFWKCTSANFSCENSAYWTTIMHYAYYLEKSLLQMILQTYSDYYTHFKADYWSKTTIILESWILLLLSLQIFTTVCSFSDLVGGVSSLCVGRCGHLLVLLLSEEKVYWDSLYRLLSRTGLPWICPGCTGPAWLPQRSAIEKRAGQPALVSISAVWPRTEVPFSQKCSLRSSCVRTATFDPDLEAEVSFYRGWSQMSSFLGGGVCPVEGVVGLCPACSDGGGGGGEKGEGCTQFPVTCLSRGGL